MKLSIFLFLSLLGIWFTMVMHFLLTESRQARINTTEQQKKVKGANNGLVH